MKWEIIIVPVIALVVAVLASIFRGAEEAKRRGGARPGSEPRRDRPRSESGGIDQFLEEIRRRQAARQESARDAERETRKPLVEPIVAQPARPVEAPRMPRPRKPSREIPTVIVAPAVPPSQPKLAVVELDVPEVIPLARSTALPVQPEPPKAGVTRADLMTLLKSGQGLQMAFVLREILDPPICRRRR
jgi:hypothetical protein